MYGYETAKGLFRRYLEMIPVKNYEDGDGIIVSLSGYNFNADLTTPDDESTQKKERVYFQN